MLGFRTRKDLDFIFNGFNFYAASERDVSRGFIFRAGRLYIRMRWSVKRRKLFHEIEWAPVNHGGIVIAHHTPEAGLTTHWERYRLLGVTYWRKV